MTANTATSADNLSARLYIFALTAIITIAFLIRIQNLDYNTPFTDEASSIIVGRLGVFQGDWWSYNAQNWMSGNPYINPVLSAITYVSGGIVGSRFLSVLLGVLTIEIVAVTAVLLSGFQDYRKYIAGLITALILAFSPVSLFVSRLSTYDSKSIYFLFSSILFLLWAHREPQASGKYYFLGFLTLMLAFLSKIIIAIYVPLLIAYTYFLSKKRPDRYYYWLRYFFIPITLSAAIYGLSSLSAIFSFAQLQASKEVTEPLQIINRIFSNLPWEWAWAGLGSFGMLIHRNTRSIWLYLAFCSIWVLLSHIVTGRALWTMDKHILISAAFLSIIAGVGIAQIISALRYPFLQVPTTVLLVLFAILYSLSGIKISKKYDYLWQNSNTLLNHMSKQEVTGKKILTENGTALMLTLYDKNPPTNNTTFDWFEYQNLTGRAAYQAAVSDGYFDIIQLTSNTESKSNFSSEISELVRLNLGDAYHLAYFDGKYEIYNRNY